MAAGVNFGPQRTGHTAGIGGARPPQLDPSAVHGWTALTQSPTGVALVAVRNKRATWPITAAMPSSRSSHLAHGAAIGREQPLNIAISSRRVRGGGSQGGGRAGREQSGRPSAAAGRASTREFACRALAQAATGLGQPRRSSRGTGMATGDVSLLASCGVSGCGCLVALVLGAFEGECGNSGDCRPRSRRLRRWGLPSASRPSPTCPRQTATS